MSVIGAILNGYGIGMGNITVGLLGQIVWISSNAGWIIKKIYEEEYSEVVMFISFWLAATFSVCTIIIQM